MAEGVFNRKIECEALTPRRISPSQEINSNREGYYLTHQDHTKFLNPQGFLEIAMSPLG